MHSGEDGTEHGFFGAFHEVRPHQRIVQTFTYEGFPDGVSLDTMMQEDLGNGRTRLRALSVVDTIEARDAMIASGMETGVVEGYERLDEVLAGLPIEHHGTELHDAMMRACVRPSPWTPTCRRWSSAPCANAA